VAPAARHHCESPGSDRRGFFVAAGLIALKRASADGVLTYFPIRIAEKLKKGGI
jgi:delta-aminolevulinic acid dehydratase/porphobilinogen synthase